MTYSLPLCHPLTTVCHMSENSLNQTDVESEPVCGLTLPMPVSAIPFSRSREKVVKTDNYLIFVTKIEITLSFLWSLFTENRDLDTQFFLDDIIEYHAWHLPLRKMVGEIGN